MTKTRTMSATPDARAADMAKLQASAERASDLLKAMGNPTRLMVLCQIVHGEKSVSELEQAVGLSQSALSQHLAVLRARGIVTARRVGQTVRYSLTGAEAVSMMAALYDIFCRKAEKSMPARRTTRAA